MKNTMIAMILVGGKGTRLGEITSETAKPAVSFGAKYRLIDFALSNLTNSNIDTCGIVTQYEPFDLMYYIGSGRSWDLDFIDGGIRFLTPFSRKKDVLWQRGTAHAVKQYFHFIKSYKARYVLILSGDHIYKMDYQNMLKHHIQNKSEVTIAANYVDPKEASRFGIFETDDQNHILGFEEKPSEPKSNLASMGIYIFSVDVLEEILGKASDDDIDFGKNIIPKCIENNKVVSVYKFDGYWKDVGTIKSLYDSNMDLLDNPDFLGLNSSKNNPVYSKSLNLNPHVMLEKGRAIKSVIADGCLINGEVIHSSIAYSCIIESGTKIINSVILPSVTIGHDCFLQNVIVNKDIIIPDNYRCETEDLILISETNMLEVGGIYE